MRGLLYNNAIDDWTDAEIYDHKIYNDMKNHELFQKHLHVISVKCDLRVHLKIYRTVFLLPINSD